MNTIRIALLAAAFAGLTLSSDVSAASVDLGLGGADCSDVKRQIRRDWMELKDFFRPNQKDLKRPRSREVYCVSPYYIRDAMPTRQRTIGLSCYNLRGSKFCCDSRKQSCAGVQ